MITHHMRGFLLAALWLLRALGAHAEGGFCPPGSYDPNNGRAPAIVCVPTAGGQQQGPQPPAQQWERRWGAIATGETKAVLGEATDRRSKSEAANAALADCAAKGGSPCKLQISYDNQCAVMVVGAKGFNFSNATAIDQARQGAMTVCGANGDASCHVYYSACSLPVRIR